MRAAQFLGQQLERRVALRGERLGRLDMAARRAQRLEVARAGDENPLVPACRQNWPESATSEPFGVSTCDQAACLFSTAT